MYTVYETACVCLRLHSVQTNMTHTCTLPRTPFPSIEAVFISALYGGVYALPSSHARPQGIHKRTISPGGVRPIGISWSALRQRQGPGGLFVTARRWEREPLPAVGYSGTQWSCAAYGTGREGHRRPFLWGTLWACVLYLTGRSGQMQTPLSVKWACAGGWGVYRCPSL